MQRQMGQQGRAGRQVITFHFLIYILQITSHLPQLQHLQEVEALRQARCCSTLRLLQISRLRQVQSNLQYQHVLSILCFSRSTVYSEGY